MRNAFVALTLIIGGTAAGSAATPLDGAWTVSQTCPPTGQDVRGFSWVYPATVRNGMFSGVHNPSGPQDGSLRLDGRIGPEGGAVLTASGRTGRPDYSVGHVAQGYPIRYSFPARFMASNGTGTRTEQRACDFTFTKN